MYHPPMLEKKIDPNTNVAGLQIFCVCVCACLCLLAISPEHVKVPPVGFQAEIICIFIKCPSFAALGSKFT